MPIFKFVQDLFGLNKTFEITARGMNPRTNQPVFKTFILKAPNSATAEDEFDRLYTFWVRLDTRRL